ncbi:DNA-entry nuclease [Paenibacillus nuruki]|uniref:DNA-entry nuclease n=1 Tax=Paenibacillus nuruki TaxID=1886670 RepID=A0A1E3KZQ8_9BACL|nr:NucA/NucB deoxyribonuclease domain-containing protein [Paenibacillus nuruki]ODP26190.1 DNA-entry nuclease [Paenibacillus nuruki]
MKKLILCVILIALAIAWNKYDIEKSKKVNHIPIYVHTTDVIQIKIPVKRYPETVQHMKEAIENGQPSICTIDRDGADRRRENSLRNTPIKKGFDRDEFPPAVCVEGGHGADIKYVHPSDNRGSGAWLGRRIQDYPGHSNIIYYALNQKTEAYRDIPL